MEDTADTARHGLSPEDARRNYVDTSSLTPRDKENAGANSTRNSQSEATDQSKPSSVALTPAPPSAKTATRSNLSTQVGDQKLRSTFFPAASPTSPAPAGSSPDLSRSVHSQQYYQQGHLQSSTPPFFASIAAQKSPPGASQVLRKHFQSLGFATPPGRQQQQRLLSTGAVRLATPSSRKKSHTKSQAIMYRLGYDGTKHTPSKELLKSTASSRSHRIACLQDVSMEQCLDDPEFEMQEVPGQLHPALEASHDDESSTVASAATTDDASFDISLPGTHQHTRTNNCLLEPESPMTPRMGCSDPVALTLLNGGKEDYHFLMMQDALFPIPNVDDRDEAASGEPKVMSSSSSSPASCLSPSSRRSPAEVRGTLSQNAMSTLARPVAVMAKAGRLSPTSSQYHPSPRLMMRPQPKHVR